MWFESLLCHGLTVIYLTSLCLSFLLYKMDKITIPISGWEGEMRTDLSSAQDTVGRSVNLNKCTAGPAFPAQLTLPGVVFLSVVSHLHPSQPHTRLWHLVCRNNFLPLDTPGHLTWFLPLEHAQRCLLEVCNVFQVQARDSGRGRSTRNGIKSPFH